MARERNDSPGGSPQPRPAASVLLLRSAADDPFEVFMVRRAAGGLWPHLYVFPGGTLHETDRGSFEAAAVRELFEETGVRLDVTALVPFSHWITPESQPHRFDTRFFLARIADDQTAQADGVETYDGCWIAPRIALLRFGAGTFPMIFPTIKHLERLLLFRSLEELFTFAQKKTIVTVTPKTYEGDSIFAMSLDLEHRW
jgi:8-oxo-dGTP pyrophosphatase MutT (NUDIX family)